MRSKLFMAGLCECKLLESKCYSLGVGGSGLLEEAREMSRGVGRPDAPSAFTTFRASSKRLLRQSKTCIAHRRAKPGVDALGLSSSDRSWSDPRSGTWRVGQC